MSDADKHAAAKKLEEEIFVQLKQAAKTYDPAGEAAQRAAHLHKQWICCYWSRYTRKAHAGLAQTYVDDARCRAYYDQNGEGLAQLLRDSIWIYTGMDETILPADALKKFP